MTYRFLDLHGLRVCVAAICFIGPFSLIAQPSTSNNKVFCTTQGPNLCINPTDDFVMSLLGCASGQENFIGPVFTINVPPGEDLQFHLHSHPSSILRSFFIITEELFTPPFTVDICNDQDGGIFVGPEFIDFNTNFPFATITIPSAVVDQMVAASNTDGRVFLISKDCLSGIENFASAEFTRNPVQNGSLDLNLISAPDVVNLDDDFFASPLRKGEGFFEIEFSITNSSNEAFKDLAFIFDAPSGGVLLEGIVVEGQSTCPGTQLCNFDIGPGQTVIIRAFVDFDGLGRVFYYGQILSDRCEDSGRIDIETLLIDDDFEAFVGSALVGLGTSAEVVLTNRDSQAIDVRLQATDENGIFASADTLGVFAQTALPLKAGNTDFRLSPGETKRFEIPATAGETNRYLIFVRGNEGMLAQIRQQRRVDTRAGTSLQGSSTSMMRYTHAVAMSGQALSYQQVVQAEQQKLILTNYNQSVSNASIVIRNATTGAIIRELTNIVLDPLRIQSFSLTQGVDDNSLIQLIAENGMALTIENNRPGEFQSIRLRPRSTTRSGIPPESNLGIVEKRQVFFAPSTLDTRYEPSQYDLFLFPGNDQSVPPGMASFSYDFECGINPENSLNLPVPAGNINGAVSVTLPNHNQPKGGYGTFDGAQIVPALSWLEGSRRFWLQPTKASTSGRIFIPRTTPLNDANPQIAEVTYQVYSDAPLMLPVAAFNRAGELQSFAILDFQETGANHLCNTDLGVTQDTAYIEYQVPEGHSSDVWFDALAVSPELDFKDQLPTHTIPGISTIATINSVLDAWDGGSSCLGTMPDISALVGFVNNGFACPTTP